MTITHLILPRNRNNHSPVTNVALTGTVSVTGSLSFVCMIRGEIYNNNATTYHTFWT